LNQGMLIGKVAKECLKIQGLSKKSSVEESRAESNEVKS